MSQRHHFVTRCRARPMRLAAVGAAAVVGAAACSAPPRVGAASTRPAISNMAATRQSPAESAVPSTAPPAPKGNAEVRIVNFTFSPATVTVRSGQTIEWTNRDSVAHTVDLSGVISNVLNRGDSYTQRFTAAGRYSYICSIHPFMHGTVVVTP